MVTRALVLVLVACSFLPVFADAGPQAPNTPSTITKYCSNGICSTPTNRPNANITNSFSVKFPIIMVIQSELCINAEKNHLKTSCPKLQDIAKYDTSNQNISGRFYSPDGVTLIRSNPQVKNHWNYYTYSPSKIVCVSCVGNFLNHDLYQTIILEPDNFTFINKYANVTNGVWNSYKDRSLQGCDVATIAYSDSLLNDTINYLKSNCTATTFNNTISHIIKSKPWQWNNPYSTLHQDTYLKSLLKGHTYDFGNKTSGGRGLGDCIRHTCTFTDPYKKAGW